MIRIPIPVSLSSLPSRLLRARDNATCTPQAGVNLCEKPADASQATTWIIVGTVLGVLVVATLSILLFLHLRRRKRDQKEDRNDRFQMADYGLRDDDDDVTVDANGLPVMTNTKKPPQPNTAHTSDTRARSNLNPFVSDDDSASVRSVDINGRGQQQSWPKREELGGSGR
ncbi:hypothetical protein QBC46DRAFT_272463 [Diplogelasinospora grovesii]|uniref:Uncharacterized protein n=1 Tax=Diplogelasinospora grovesii TaxID=303347 RepID=A0AAN6MX55_9PEZI|nr:hypothetical protein QBC46DRAFT_272463 [Diplogelasinospora grovesii]